MQTIGREQLNAFIHENEILYGTIESPGLMMTPAGEIVKSFYRRKKISTTVFIPQANQFIASSKKLLARDISAPVVKQVLYCSDIPVHMVIYDRLDGLDLRELCATRGVTSLSRLPDYLAHLHKIGIYFRAIHLGNILIDGNKISLLDISDLSVRNSSLGVFQRARNLGHMLNSVDDKTHFASYGVSRFISEYIDAVEFTPVQNWLFRKRLHLALDSDVQIEALMPQREASPE